jgi:putative MATE family efflux protein
MLTENIKAGGGKNEFFRTLIGLALPISLQNLIAFTVNFADNVMVGRLGDLAISGVFLGNQIHSMLQILTIGIEGSLVILGTQYWGKKDVQSIRSLTSICLRAAFAAGGLFTFFISFFPREVAGILSNKTDVVESAAVYIRIIGISFIFFTLSQVLVASQRCVEKVRFGMNIALITLGINIGLNYVLIFGKLGFPALGIKGAAIATLISRIIEFSIAAAYIFGFDKRIAISLKDFMTVDKFLGRSLIKYGSPIVAGNVVWAANSFAYTYIVGRFSANIIASFNIAGMMNTLVYIWMSGLASGVGIMTGKMVGSGAGLDVIKPHAYRVQRFFSCVGLATGLFVFLFKDLLISMYTVSPEAAAAARLLLYVHAITIMGTAYQMPCLAGLVKAGGNISFVFRNDTIFVFLVVIPASITALVLGAEPWLVFFCLKCDQILKCFVAAVVINRFRWIKNLTKG